MEQPVPMRSVDQSVLYGQYTTEQSYSEAPLTVADSESEKGLKFRFQRGSQAMNSRSYL